MAQDANPTPQTPDVDAALAELRVEVAQILEDGADPREVLALGRLVMRHAPENTDLSALRDALTNSSLGEVVGEAAFAIESRDSEDDDDQDEDEEDDLLIDEDEELLGDEG